jgi:gas vesicle protein
MKNYSNVLLSLGIGLAAGGILGILFAPDKGSETRRKIKQSGSKLSKTVNDKINITKNNLDKMKEKFKMNVDGVEETGSEFI